MDNNRIIPYKLLKKYASLLPFKPVFKQTSFLLTKSHEYNIHNVRL